MKVCSGEKEKRKAKHEEYGKREQEKESDIVYYCFCVYKVQIKGNIKEAWANRIRPREKRYTKKK